MGNGRIKNGKRYYYRNKTTVDKEKIYDQIQNEGAEGYNPYREQRLDRERAEEREYYKTLGGRKELLMRKIESMDNAIARESGTYDKNAVDKLKEELKKIEAEEDARFLSVWTKDVTNARRAEWNARVRSGEFGKGKIDIRLVDAAEKKQGWTMNDLKKAVRLNNIK